MDFAFKVAQIHSDVARYNQTFKRIGFMWLEYCDTQTLLKERYAAMPFPAVFTLKEVLYFSACKAFCEIQIIILVIGCLCACACPQI